MIVGPEIVSVPETATNGALIRAIDIELNSIEVPKKKKDTVETT